MKRIIPFLLLLLAALAGCTSNQALSAPPSYTLAGDWQLVRFTQNGSPVKISVATLSLSLQGDSPNMYAVSGFSGVNNYSGSFTIAGENLIPSQGFISTRMAGDTESMAFEDAYMKVITANTSWKLKDVGGTWHLVLNASDKSSELEFSRLTLAGTSWKLIARNTGNAVSSVSTDEESASLSFGYDEEVSGNAGPQTRIRMSYASDEVTRALSLYPEAADPQADDDMGEAEREYISLLSRVVSYSLSGRNLSLSDANGTTLLVFAVQDPV